MGMGYAAVQCDTVEQSFVEEMCPEEWKALQETVVECGLDWEEIIPELAGESLEEDSIIDAYGELVAKFEQVTGLSLNIGYHNSQDEGSRYDDIDGTFWSVGRVYEYSPAGEKWKDKITPAAFVTFG